MLRGRATSRYAATLTTIKATVITGK